MEDLSYQTRLQHKEKFSHYSVRKDHILLVPGQDFPSVKVRNMAELVKAMENFEKVLKPNVGANGEKKKEKKKEKKQKSKQKRNRTKKEMQLTVMQKVSLILRIYIKP